MVTYRLVAGWLILSLITGCAPRKPVEVPTTPVIQKVVETETVHVYEEGPYTYYVVAVKGFDWTQKHHQELADFLTTMSVMHKREFVNFIWMDKGEGLAMIILRKKHEPEPPGEDF